MMTDEKQCPIRKIMSCIIDYFCIRTSKQNLILHFSDFSTKNKNNGRRGRRNTQGKQNLLFSTNQSVQNVKLIVVT